MKLFPESRSVDSLAAMFLRLRPRLEAQLRRYEIPPKDATSLLEETIMELLYKGDRIADPASWLVSRLRRRCRLFWADRRNRLWAAVDRIYSAGLSSRSTTRS